MKNGRLFEMSPFPISRRILSLRAALEAVSGSKARLTVSLHETNVCSPRSRRKVASHADPEIPGFIRIYVSPKFFLVAL